MCRTKLLTVLIFLLLTLTACKEKTADTSGIYKGTVLNVVSSFDETDGNRDIYSELIDSFVKTTGAVVNDISTKSDEKWKSDVINDFNNGNIPDILFFFTNIPEITSKTVSIDIIREYYPTYAEHINAAVLNVMKEKDGNVYAIPVTGFWEGVFINKSLFTDNGIEIPADYDTMLETVRRFAELSITPIAASLKYEPHYLFEFMLYNKSGPAGHTGMNVVNDITKGLWVEGLEEFNRLYELGAFPEDINIAHSQAVELFNQKKAAMLVDGSWRVGSITDVEDVIVIPFPGSAARKSTDLLSGFSMGFYITQEAWEDDAKRDAAVAFVETMCEKESVVKFNRNGSASPVPSEAAGGDSNLLKSINEMNESATAFIPAIQDRFNPKAREMILSDIVRIATGEITSAEAVENFKKLNETE